MSELVKPKRAAVRLSDIPLTLFAPRRVFARVEDVAGYGWPLALLLVTVTMVGFATVETGLIDREVDRAVQRSIADIEREQFDIVERSALSQMIEEKRKEGEFLRLMARVRVVAARPIATLATVLLLAAFFYGLVALTGRKPEWHTLLTVFVLASFVSALGLVVRLGLMLWYRTLEVDTSLALLSRSFVPQEAANRMSLAVSSGLLSAVDPFRMWFWFVIVVGLTATSQLRGWKVWTVCTLLWLSAAGVRTALACGMAAGSVPA